MNNTAYFSNIRHELITLLAKAESEVLVAMAWFTNSDLLDALINCLHRGIKVKVILLDDIINHCEFGVDFNMFIKEPGSEFYLYPKNRKFMHHKFCIIDSKFLITGSYNWTNYAESRNLENIVLSTDSSLIQTYQEYFNLLLKDLSQEKSFDIIAIDNIPEQQFLSRLSNLAEEFYSSPRSIQSQYRDSFDQKVAQSDINMSEIFISVFNNDDNAETQHITDLPKIITTTVSQFKYAVSKYNIGFKAKLIDQNGKEGLKVLIKKGQALPYTVTMDAKSANSGDYAAMSSTCEFYYGDSVILSSCTKFGDTLTLNDLPMMNEGEVKFKIIVTLDETGRLHIKFACVNTGKGIESKQINKDFIEYRES